MILESQNAMSAADGATTEWRTRINRPDDGRGRCKGSKAPDQHKDFSQCMQQSKTPSTSNVISPRQERTEPFGPRRCRHGTRSSPRREPDMPAQLLRALFGNLTEPKEGFKSANIRKTARRASHFPASPPMSSPCAILRSRQPRGAFMGLSRGRDTRHRDAAPCSWRRAKGSVHFC
jgi:hypothetical protein